MRAFEAAATASARQDRIEAGAKKPTRKAS
jgi:hypothetical protein